MLRFHFLTLLNTKYLRWQQQFIMVCLINYLAIVNLFLFIMVCLINYVSLILFLFSEERRLADDEKPLLVQLNWNKDDREGRFLLRRVDLSGVS